MSYRIDAIAPARAWQEVLAVEPLIKRACSRRGCEVDWVPLIDDCGTRLATLWIITQAGVPVGVCLTRIVKRPDALVVDNMATGGFGGCQWAAQLRSRLHEYRKAEGADMLIARGRRGWGRLLGMQPTGFEDGKWIFEDRG